MKTVVQVLTGAISVLFFTIPAYAGFVAVSFQGPSNVYLLNDNMSLISSFQTNFAHANAVAVNGQTIYAGSWDGTGEVRVYDIFGNLQNSFSLGAPGGSNLQGMAFVNGELAITNQPPTNQEIRFFNSSTGAYIRAFPDFFNDESLTFDGTNILALGPTSIVKYNPVTGAIVGTLPNAASGFPFGGTGLAVLPGGAGYMIGGTDGSWVRVDAAGIQTAIGNNGIPMYGLEYIDLQTTGVPEPATLGLLAGGALALFLARRRPLWHR